MQDDGLTLVDALLAEQRTLTPVERFSQEHSCRAPTSPGLIYRDLLPSRSPQAGEQYAFQVDLDACSGCKACVSACHSLNGLDEHETWRSVGLLHGLERIRPVQQTVTTACHHCVDPGCLSGCPVLAYDKDPATGIVRHLDDQCIGCQYCVMKCPYEVPVYSKARGIVRKCDLCVNRLAVGEAPACAQACPSGAITITLIAREAIRRQFRAEPSGNTFLPDSPDPSITLPSTRYVTQRPATLATVAADGHQPRLEHPHWPLVFMLVLTQASAGMWLAGACHPLPVLGRLTAFALLALGLGVAPLHLGQPLKAWRAWLGWRTSWLSREILAFGLFGSVSAAATTLPWLAARIGSLSWLEAWVSVGAAVTGLAAVLASAMVYIDTHRPVWSPRVSLGNFLGTTAVVGAAVAAALCHVTGAADAAFRYALFAVFSGSVLFAWRQREHRLALDDEASPIHLNARAVTELLPGPAAVYVTLAAGALAFLACSAGNVLGWASGWSVLAAFALVPSEICARYLFFTAGAGQRMPGGVGV